MKKCVLDSSVFIKLFLPVEEHSKTALRLIDKMIDEQVEALAPKLFYYEVFGSLRKNGRPLEEVLDAMQYYERSLLSYVNEDLEITKKTLSICENGNDRSGFPSFYDSCYHAIAILNDCDFITADRRHYEKTKNLGNIKLLSEMAITPSINLKIGRKSKLETEKGEDFDL